MKAHAWTDGSNGRSNGPAGAAAYVIADSQSKEIIFEHCELFPHTDELRFTNNDMEMTAVYLCIQKALSLGVSDLKVHSDSEWTVNILLQKYRLRNAKFESLVNTIWDIASEFDDIQIIHVRREFNSRADWLCSVATDQKRALKAPPSISWTRLRRSSPLLAPSCSIYRCLAPTDSKWTAAQLEQQHSSPSDGRSGVWRYGANRHTRIQRPRGVVQFTPRPRITQSL